LFQFSYGVITVHRLPTVFTIQLIILLNIILPNQGFNE
jgi:hypothetical protein